MVYETVPADALLVQGDIVDGCPVVALAPPEDDPAGPITERRQDLRVIVLTQTCDIAQSKTGRVVVAPVFPTDLIVAAGLMKPAQIRDQVRTHRTFGWYFLPAAPAPMAVPESVVDFRQLYTLPRRVLEELTASGNRVGRLATPFREHLAQHFAVTYMRIALPEPYPTAP